MAAVRRERPNVRDVHLQSSRASAKPDVSRRPGETTFLLFMLLWLCCFPFAFWTRGAELWSKKEVLSTYMVVFFGAQNSSYSGDSRCSTVSSRDEKLVGFSYTFHILSSEMAGFVACSRVCAFGPPSPSPCLVCQHSFG